MVLQGSCGHTDWGGKCCVCSGFADMCCCCEGACCRCDAGDQKVSLDHWCGRLSDGRGSHGIRFTNEDADALLNALNKHSLHRHWFRRVDVMNSGNIHYQCDGCGIAVTESVLHKLGGEYEVVE